MKKILVPMDFSIASSWGFYYAYDLAAAIHAELIVLHIFLPEEESLYSMEKEDLVQKKKYKLIRHLKEATQQSVSNKLTPVPIQYQVEYGTTGQITEFAKEYEVDLVIMGTHGQGKSIDKIFGSNTSHVIKKAHCPVLAVPQGATFKVMQHIAYATNFDSNDKDVIAELMDLVATTKSKLHCVHINLIDKEFSTPEAQQFQKDLKENFQHLPITYSPWSATSVEEGLGVFCRVNHIQMLSVLTRKAAGWEKLFGKKSTTNLILQDKMLPILVFRR